MLARVYASTLARLPPVPSLVPIYKGTASTTTNETTTTFAGIDIGVPHPKRLVVVSTFHGVAAPCTVAVNGIAAFQRAGNTTHEFQMHACQVPTGLTGSIAVSATSSLRKAILVYVLYPQVHAHLDSAFISAATTLDAVLADVKVQAGGCLIYCGGQMNAASDFTTTWEGVDAVVTDAEMTVETTSSFTGGRINITGSSDLNDLTMNCSVSQTKRLIATVWGP